MSLFGPTPEYRRKPDHVRSVILLCVAVVIALCATFVSFAAQYSKAKDVTLVSDSVVPAHGAIEADEKNPNPVQSVFAPNLVSVLGLSADQAVEQLGHGATITKTEPAFWPSGAPYKKVTVTLTSERADKLTGTPTVYLALGEEDKVVEIGYQAGLWYLGYGSLSFTDAVNNAHVVEKLLTEAGLPVAEGAVSAPADKAVYGQYGADGVTLEREVHEFTGVAALDDATYNWRSIVDYDYSFANETSHLANTIRYLSVYISKA